MLLLLAAWSFGVARADAGEPPAGDGAGADRAGFLAWMLHRANAEIDAASAALEPPPVPPIAIKVKWQARRVGSLDLGAPLLAVTAADLDRDGRAELVAVTTGEVVVIEVGRKSVIVARVPLPALAAPLRPRDPVGVVVAEPAGDQVEVLARTSEQATGGVYGWRDGTLVELTRQPGFPLGAGARGELAPGRNYFTADQVARPGGVDMPVPPPSFYAAVDRGDMVDPSGYPLTANAFITTDGNLQLYLTVTCRPTHAPCPAPTQELPPLPHAGVAAAIGDVDNDGYPEVVIAGDRAPGDADQVTVVTARAGRFDTVYRRKFNGGVAGLAVAELDGDRDLDVVAVVRLVGSTRIDLWILDD